jgi:zeaxanthin glucosyltransferase
MKHIGIFCPPLTGHLNPMATLGRTLIRRGHRVTLFQASDAGKRARDQGLDFRHLGAPSPELTAMIDKMGRLSGLASLRFVVKGASRLAEITCREAPPVLLREKVDLLLVDQNEPAGGTVAEHLGIPFLSVAPSLLLNREPGIPPTFVPWSYSPGAAASLRNRFGYALSNRLISPINRILNQFRRKWGLAPLRSPDDSFSRLAQLCQVPRDFDFPRFHLPPHVHYLGPFLDNCTGGQSPPFPFDRLDGRPLIYASLGTLQSGAMEYFQRIAEACAPLTSQLVIATGLFEGEMPPFTGDPIAVKYAPQMELLSRASLTITHAGLNTTMQSLYFGVPMVAIPMTHDQPAIAARIHWTGSGLVIPPKQATVPRLRQSIERVMAEPSFRAAADRLRAAIVRSGGVERGADIVEHWLQGKNAQ